MNLLNLSRNIKHVWIDKNAVRQENGIIYLSQECISVNVNGEPKTVVILRGDIFEDDERNVKNLLSKSRELNLEELDQELAKTLRKAFSIMFLKDEPDSLDNTGIVDLVMMSPPFGSTEQKRLLSGRNYSGRPTGDFLDIPTTVHYDFANDTHKSYNDLRANHGFVFTIPLLETSVPTKQVKQKIVKWYRKFFNSNN